LRSGLVITLSSALFKSYLRSSRQNASLSFFSKPKFMLALDIVLFVIPAIGVQFIVGAVPADLDTIVSMLLVQAMISLPVLMTSAVIVSGLMFELGQGSAISSSEAVNWLPVTPREYVAASALSTSFLYSAFLAVSAGVTLPLVVKYGFFYAWPVMMLLSAFSLLLGAFIVEFLKSIMNRLSAEAYKKSGRLTMAVRLIALVILLAIIQLAFQPSFLSWFFGKIVAGIEVVWMVPFVWPSAAMVSLLGYEVVKTVVYTILSAFFVIVLYETASLLRRRYWSPIPISISIDEFKTYVPKDPITGFGFSPLASLLALKEFRALTRRKDLARFIAIPVVLIVSFMAPSLFSPSDMGGRAPSFFLIAIFMPLFVPLMFSSTSIGQEGKSIADLLSLPLKPVDLIKGKLAPAWLLSCAATFAAIGIMEFVAPMGLPEVLATLAVSTLAIFINSFIGLGVGTRWPDYTVGARSRYVTLKGFFIGFALSGLAVLTVYAPMVAYFVTNGEVRGSVPTGGFDLIPMLTISMVLGAALLVLSYVFCKRGVKNLLSNL
jgi:hypothetical protein